METNSTTFSDLTMYSIDPRSVELLPLAYCRHNQVVILGKVGEKECVHVGMLDPEDTTLIHDISARLARQVTPVRLNAYEINRTLNYRLEAPESEDVVIQMTDRDPSKDSSAVKMVEYILQEAVKRGASDIHIESWFHDVDLRLRIDGILHQVFTHMNPDNVGEVINRIKVLSVLDITERRRPQDGRIRVLLKDNGTRKLVDFRVSVVPSPSGEDVVIRVLDASRGLLTLEQLGMPKSIRETFVQLLNNPEGMLLVTGPTGSGKTTSLYASLAHMRGGARKIITAEDPIEYYIDKINQKETTHKMSIKDLMRAMMRQDPDVLLFGEIRDTEMGEMALEASTTGHVVLSTLHTADAVGAVTRLRSLNLEDADIAGAILGVVAQRLVRRVCSDCKAETQPTPGQEQLFGDLLRGGLSLQKGEGCQTCYGTGYKGRVGLFELLIADEAFQDLVASHQRRSELRRHLLKKGFRTLLEDGLEKVGRGLTTLEELERVLPFRHIVDGRQDLARKLSS